MASWDEIGVVIRTVPDSRAASRAALIAQCATFGVMPRIAYHQPGRSVPESYADALSAWGDERPYVLQFEDDIVLHPRFGTHVPRLLATLAGRTDIGLVSWYSGRRVRPGERIPASPALEILPGGRFLMAQAILLPVTAIADHNAYMLAWTSQAQRPYGTDTATGLWLAARRLRFARVWPSLVQHLNRDSLYGHYANSNRQASSFQLPEQEARSYA